MSDIYYKTRTGQLYGLTIALIVVTTVVVVLRLVARKISAVGFGWDDWTIVLALVLYYGLNITYWIQAGAGGLGRHTATVEAPVDQAIVMESYQVSMATQILYFSTSVALKTSLVLLYYRIFGVSRWYRASLVLAESIVCCYFLVCLFIAIFECKPVSYYWDKSISGRCINETQFYRWNGVANLLIDFMILSLTFPMVRCLQRPFRQKLALSGIFLLGTCVIAASIARVVSFEKLNSDDNPYMGVTPAIWTDTEQALGIVCACLPCLQPLFSKRCPLYTSDSGSRSGSAQQSRDIRLSRVGLRKIPKGRVTRKPAGYDSTAVFTRLGKESATPATMTTVTRGSRSGRDFSQDGIIMRQSVELRYDES